MNKSYYKIILAGLIIVAIGILMDMKCGLFAYYGLGSIQQQQGLENLFQQSSIISLRQTLKQAFPFRQTKEDLVLDIIYLLQQTQKKFVVHTGSQERWEVKELEWMTQNKTQILADLKILGFVDALMPKQKSTDAFCILGTSAPDMTDRINYANSLIQSGLRTKAIILLAGERYATKDIDGTKEALIQTANTFHLRDWKKLTEAHLIQDVYRKSSLYDKEILTYVIDTPRRDLPRPTTHTTILELIEWLKKHKNIKT